MFSSIIEYQDAITFTASILGLFIAVPLIALRRQRFANIYLGMFLVAFSLLCLASTGLYISYPHLFGLLDWPLSCLGTFYFLYVRAMCGHKFTKRDFLHFVPLLVFSIILVDIRFGNGVISSINYFGFYLLFFQLLTVVYALAVLLLLKQYRLAVQNNYSSDKDRDLKWLNWLTFTLISLLIIWIPATMFDGVWQGMLIFGRLLILFFVGWYGLLQNFVFIEQNTTPQDSFIDKFFSEDKYQRSGMNEAIKKNIEFKLQQRMFIEKDFLKSDLKLTELASEINTSPQHLSEYFNQILETNFFAYINELRTIEAKRLLSDSSYQNLSILDIAFESGFNSKSTFNVSFKKFCGESPTAWRNKHLQAS